MRGMPSICNIAQRVCAARGANIRLVESFFATPAKKLKRLALRFGLASRFSCGGQAAYDRDLRSLSIFKSRFVLTRVEMRNEKPKRPREPFRLLRRRFESNENQYDEFLGFTLHNRFKNYGVDSNCHQSTDAVAVNLPTQVQGRSPGKSQRLRTCGYIYDGGTSSRLLRDFSSHSTFHGKPSPRLDRLGVRWLSGSEPFTETHRRHCVTVSCRNNVKV